MLFQVHKSTEHNIESHLISAQLELLTEVILSLFIKAGSESLFVW